jgi:O-antigen/teichoic acid export membrane protein
MISSAMMAGFGFVSWLIIARLFSAHDVGLATTMVSVMGLIASLSVLGFNTGLIRFLPNSKRKNDKINTAFTIVVLTTIIISSIFLIGLNKFSPELTFIRDSLLLSLVFIFFMIISVSNSLIESIFIALRKTKFTLIKNSIFSVLRIILPFVFVSFGAFGAFSVYVSALFVGVGVALLILVYKFDYKPKLVFYDKIIDKMGKYSLGNYFAGFIGGLSLLILPLMITNVINPTTTAYYFMAIQIANLLFVIPSATTNSLFAEGSYDENGLGKQIKKSIRIISILLIPSIVIIVLFGNYILLAFGSEYSSAGFNFLRIMALSGIFVGINSIFGGILKVKKNIRRILYTNMIGMVVILGGSFILIRNDYGLMGIGIAYISGQVAMALSYGISSFKK